MPRPPTRPVAIPRSANDAHGSRPTPASPNGRTLRPSRPELPAPAQDEEMTVMMASKSAGVLPPPPDPRAARIPRQWSPVDQMVPQSGGHVANMNAYAHIPGAPTMPSVSIPPPDGFPLKAHSSVPAAPSSLVGLSVSAGDTTARVRNVVSGGSALGKFARPTLSWAAALVAVGIFVGVGSAVVSRNDSLRAKVGMGSDKAGQSDAKGDAKSGEKAAKGTRLGAAALPLPSSTASVAVATKFATPPPPLTPPPLPAAALTPPTEVTGVVPSTPVARPADPMADLAALAAGVTPPKPRATTQPIAAPAAPARARLPRSSGALGPEARDALELAKNKAENKPESKAEAPAPVATAAAAAPAPAPAAPNAPAPPKASKQKEIDLSKQAADLAAEQMKSLL